MKLTKETLSAIAAAASSRLSSIETASSGSALAPAPFSVPTVPADPAIHNNNNRNLRRLPGADTCDAAFLSCILNPTCRECFSTLQENEVDWTNVVPDTPCNDILGFLMANGHCATVKDSLTDNDTFCSAFDSCVVWDGEEDGVDDDMYKETKKTTGAAGEGPTEALNCYALTECKWEGMHPHFLGDGICHDAMPGCYNSKACGYDGGDCCEDTCNDPFGDELRGSIYETCGAEGWSCADPESEGCVDSFARINHDFCKRKHENGEEIEGEDDMGWLFNDDDATEETETVSCSSSQTAYRLVEYDSWGDGWDETVLELSERDAASTAPPLYKGGLNFGSEGTVPICLTKNQPTCYHVTVNNGVWGNEVSWELRPSAVGAPVLAAGGSPSDCTIPLGGLVDGCPNTCDSTRPDTTIMDPDYEGYKQLESCLEQKCMIQVGACADDAACSVCMQEETPQFCYADENFNALIDCSMCSCTASRPAYCDAKQSGTASSSASAKAVDTGSTKETHEGTSSGGGAAEGKADEDYKGAMCNPKSTMLGTQALEEFSQCADMDKMMAMITEFDNKNFGQLDLFEDCATTYQRMPMHGGKKAMDCMKILSDIIIEEEGDDETLRVRVREGDKVISEHVAMAISTLAKHLYHDAEEFCVCAASANSKTPSCNSFVHFKTLLFEATDACRSLDIIDCAAWEEFYIPCRQNLVQMFNAVNFKNSEQCSYIENQCGGAGPFPAFRRLDCGGEISKPAWDFHTEYSRDCLEGASSSAPAPKRAPRTPPPPVPVPKAHDHVPAVAPKRAPFHPGDSDANKKPYYHSDDDVPAVSPNSANEYASSSEGKKKGHGLRNTFFAFSAICLVGYGVHKRRSENFNYERFRQMRQRNYGGDLNLNSGGGGYAGVSSMEDSSSFEPPSLPPTPLTML